MAMMYDGPLSIEKEQQQCQPIDAFTMIISTSPNGVP